MKSVHALLSIQGLEIAYPSQDGNNSVIAVKNLNLDLMAGEIGCLLGSSGCGKSTVLRAICGFEPLKSGEIFLRNKLVSSTSIILPPGQRRVGMVFQDFALFPHLNALENVSFGLQHLSSQQRNTVAMNWLNKVSLSDKAKSYPHELSGGQQQRVALARAMAPEPDLILLKANCITALLVTHDQIEAFAIADKVGVMADGKILQWDVPYELYHKPATRYVADFIGRGVFIKGEVLGGNRVKIEIGELEINQDHNIEIGKEIDVLIRADDIQHDDNSSMQAEVVSKTFRGADFLYTLKLQSGVEVLALVPSHHNHGVGEKIGITLALDHVVTF
jgi:iron(III) transport system ATP-binding protein